MSDAAVFKAEQEHDSAATDGDYPSPINGFESCRNWSFGRLNVKKQEDDGEGEAVEWY